MSPENQWLEDVFPTKIVPFFRDMLVFRGVQIFRSWFFFGIEIKSWTFRCFLFCGFDRFFFPIRGLDDFRWIKNPVLWIYHPQAKWVGWLVGKWVGWLVANESVILVVTGILFWGGVNRTLKKSDERSLGCFVFFFFSGIILLNDILESSLNHCKDPYWNN